MEEGVEEIPLGLYLVKGDMMCVQAPLFPPFASLPLPLLSMQFLFSLPFRVISSITYFSRLPPSRVSHPLVLTSSICQDQDVYSDAHLQRPHWGNRRCD